MEDNTTNLLPYSKHEWCMLLINYLTPCILNGINSIFNESVQLCKTNDEPEKYLMTFQNLLTRIPKWNNQIIEVEKIRIIEETKCKYLEDLMVCVHVVQLKILTCARLTNETKKINIDIPDLSSFIHNVYINIARKLYSNIYLFEIDISSLETQKRKREMEIICETCIMNTIRDNIPIDNLLKQYIEEKTDVIIGEKENPYSTPEPSIPEPTPQVSTPVSTLEPGPIEPSPEPTPLVSTPEPILQVSTPEPNTNVFKETESKIKINEDLNEIIEIPPREEKNDFIQEDIILSDVETIEPDNSMDFNEINNMNKENIVIDDIIEL